MESQFFEDAVFAVCIIWGATALGVITYLIIKKVGNRG